MTAVVDRPRADARQVRDVPQVARVEPIRVILRATPLSRALRVETARGCGAAVIRTASLAVRPLSSVSPKLS